MDKYLEYHKLSKNGKKADKALQILAHKLQDDLPERLSVATEVDTAQESSDSDGFSEGEDQDSDSDSDVILTAFGESEEEEDTISNAPTEGSCNTHTTRTGRRVTSWQNRFGEEWES